MNLDKIYLRQQFQEKLDLFCFFHLGVDTQVELVDEGGHLRVGLEQHRITPVTFTLSYEILEEMLSETTILEEFMLNKITPYRR